MDTAFEMAQALRKTHCDRKGHEHECVGELTVKRGEVCLNCQLCGEAEVSPGWNAQSAIELAAIFRAAGVHWESLSLDAQLAAIRSYKEQQDR